MADERADQDPLAQFEERIRKLEGDLAGLREALQALKPAAAGEEKKAP